MTSSDAPQPPGGPLRQDAPDGGLPRPAADDAPRTHARPADRDESPNPVHPDDAGVPPVSHDEPEQSASQAALQEENAETSADQPSS